MSLNKNSGLGNIQITDKAVATLVGSAVLECYGVVGVTSKRIRDSIKDYALEVLKKENYTKGVIVSNKNNAIVVDLYLILAFEVRVSQVIFEVQKRVKYVLEKTLNIDVKEVNVHVEGIKVSR